MTEMQVYHETFRDHNYVALVVVRDRNDKSITPWQTDEIIVRKALEELPIMVRYKEMGSYDTINIKFPFNDTISRFLNYCINRAFNGNLEGTLADLRELNLNSSEGLPEIVKKLLQ